MGISKCSILGVDISAINMEIATNYVLDNLDSLSGEYICVSNVHTTVMSYEDDQYRSIQNNAIMAFPDGKPLSIIAKHRGFKEVDRVTGPDFMNKVFEKPGYKHYFYGSTNETLELLEKKLKSKFGDIQIVGMFSPPFRELTEEEESSIIKQINRTNPDFIWVGLGAPKQEKWMSKNRGKLSGVMIGVGAGFDYHAEKIKRAPMWMQKLSLEWIYRLFQEPKRLFSRYLKTNLKFLWLIFLKKSK